MQSAGWAKQVIDLEKPVRIFIDVGGVGAGVYDRLVEMGYGDIVRAVNFGSQPLEPAPLDPHGKPSGGPNVYAGVRAEQVATLAAEIAKAESKLEYARAQLTRTGALAHNDTATQQALIRLPTT